jgi:hypothetical protein
MYCPSFLFYDLNCIENGKVKKANQRLPIATRTVYAI